MHKTFKSAVYNIKRHFLKSPYNFQTKQTSEENFVPPSMKHTLLTEVESKYINNVLFVYIYKAKIAKEAHYMLKLYNFI